MREHDLKRDLKNCESGDIINLTLKGGKKKTGKFDYINIWGQLTFLMKSGDFRSHRYSANEIEIINSIEHMREGKLKVDCMCSPLVFFENVVEAGGVEIPIRDVHTIYEALGEWLRTRK